MPVAIVSTPRASIASRALTARFSTAFSSCTRSARTRQPLASSRVITVIASPSVRSSSSDMPVTSAAASIGSGLQRFLATEREQAAGQRSGPIGAIRCNCRCGRAAGRRIGGDAALGEFEPPEHDREHVVEIVRDAAGELAHRLHLLDLAQLRFLQAQFVGGMGYRRLQLDRAFASRIRLGPRERFLAHRAQRQPAQRDRTQHDQDAEHRQHAPPRGSTDRRCAWPHPCACRATCVRVRESVRASGQFRRATVPDAPYNTARAPDCSCRNWC